MTEPSRLRRHDQTFTAETHDQNFTILAVPPSFSLHNFSQLSLSRLSLQEPRDGGESSQPSLRDQVFHTDTLPPSLLPPSLPQRSPGIIIPFIVFAQACRWPVAYYILAGAGAALQSRP